MVYAEKINNFLAMSAFGVFANYPKHMLSMILDTVPYSELASMAKCSPVWWNIVMEHIHTKRFFAAWIDGVCEGNKETAAAMGAMLGDLKKISLFKKFIEEGWMKVKNDEFYGQCLAGFIADSPTREMKEKAFDFAFDTYSDMEYGIKKMIEMRRMGASESAWRTMKTLYDDVFSPMGKEQFQLEMFRKAREMCEGDLEKIAAFLHVVLIITGDLGTIDRSLMRRFVDKNPGKRIGKYLALLLKNAESQEEKKLIGELLDKIFETAPRDSHFKCEILAADVSLVPLYVQSSLWDANAANVLVGVALVLQAKHRGKTEEFRAALETVSLDLQSRENGDKHRKILHLRIRKVLRELQSRMLKSSAHFNVMDNEFIQMFLIFAE